VPEATQQVAPFTGTPANKSAAAAAATQSPSTTPSEHAITLVQFGIEFSKSEKRVELLNAFLFLESQAGNVKDTKSNYLARFAAFVHQPVNKG